MPLSLQSPLAEEAPAEAGLSGSGRPLDLSSLRVLIVHDWIAAWGGAERAVEQMLAVLPQAELVVGVLGEGLSDRNVVTRRARETWLARLPRARSHHRWFLPFYWLAFASVDTRGFDLVISSSSAFSKMVRPQAGTPHLCYCYTPPRYLWDLEEAYQGDGGGLAGRALALAGPILRRLDRWSAKRVTHFVAISHYIAGRIARTYGREATVVYPPVAPKPSAPTAEVRDDVFLSLSRLVPYKRVDLAVAAATTAGLPLIVAGEGPERERLERIAGPTVTFVGEVSEERAGELMERCAAMIFCAEEDFGIAPVEANAHGLPVVAYGRGASLETMVDGVSGVLFAEATVASVLDGMRRVRARTWDREAMRRNAERFSAQAFRDGFAEAVRSVMAGTPSLSGGSVQ